MKFNLMIQPNFSGDIVDRGTIPDTRKSNINKTSFKGKNKLHKYEAKYSKSKKPPDIRWKFRSRKMGRIQDILMGQVALRYIFLLFGPGID